MSASPVYTDLRDQLDVEPPRALPSNTDAEQALLGALLIDNRAFVRVAKIVRSYDFAWGVHGRIFDAIGKLIKIGSPANPVTLKHLFDGDPALWKAYKGGKYLKQLAASAITVSNGPDCALIIADLALRRDLIADLSEPKAAETTIDILAAQRPRVEALAKAARELAPARRGANGRR